MQRPINLNSSLLGGGSEGGVVGMALHQVIGVRWLLALSGGWAGVQSSMRHCMHLIDLNFPLLRGVSEGEVVGVALH